MVLQGDFLAFPEDYIKSKKQGVKFRFSIDGQWLCALPKLLEKFIGQQ